MEKEVLEKILTAGIQAPSGDNCQPWLFERHGKTIKLLSDNEFGEHFLNSSQRATLIAMGAAIENMSIAAAALGYDLRYSLEMVGVRITIAMNFLPIKQAPDPLTAAIYERHTNRSRYNDKPLTESASDHLKKDAKRFPNINFELVTDKNKDQLVKLLCLNEKILLSNKYYHADVFHWMRSPAQARRTRDGLEIRTVGVGFIDACLMLLMRSWPFTRMLVAMGLGNVASIKSFHNYRHSAAIGFMQSSSYSPEAIIELGRCFERIWLVSTNENIAFQPMMGVSFLLASIRDGLTNFFSRRQLRELSSTEAEFKKIVPFDTGKGLALFFRMGYSDTIPVKTMRQDLVAFWSE